ncbi:MAG: hypothetical protein DWI12_12235 [Planctomycetota bacterium]|nr:MAG: hypothetical protein DWI12_12235 [Planctomycetota bacterium]
MVKRDAIEMRGSSRHLIRMSAIDTRLITQLNMRASIRNDARALTAARKSLSSSIRSAAASCRRGVFVSAHARVTSWQVKFTHCFKQLCE